MNVQTSRAASAARAAALLLAALLSACGGGGDTPSGPPAPPATCSVAAQQTWLGDYMRDWYFWYRLAPNPNPAAFRDVPEYLQALLYQGDTTFPSDRWSRTESTESFNRFFGEGRTLGYGLSVAGLEVTGQPEQPLRVRYVEPQGDAAAKGVRRGEQVVSLGGRSAADLIGANDFALLTPDQEGQQLGVVLLDAAGAQRSLTLRAAVFAVTPVVNATVQRTPANRSVGYVMVNTMINQTLPPLAEAITQFRDQGVTDVVLDLRYNGGGSVSVGATLASHLIGNRSAGSLFARLLYNDRRAATNNQDFLFTQPRPSLRLPRVIVLAGRRTCSASEQLVNGLRPFADVVLIGETTCGKPVGFVPASQCGTTYNVVNFESVNSRNEGRYWDGFAPTCAVAEDFSQPLRSAGDPLWQAAQRYVDSGSCPAGATGQARPLSSVLREGPVRQRSDEREDMFPG